MIKKLTIGFFVTTLLLVASEYVFLNEVFSSKRTVVLAAGLAGIATASFFFFRFFVRYHKVLKDS